MRISDWSSDVCSSDLPSAAEGQYFRRHPADLRFVAAADAAYRHPDDGQSRRRRIGVGGFPDPAQPVSRARPATLHGPLWRVHYLLLLLLCLGRLQSRGNRRQSQAPKRERKSVGEGKRVAVSVDLGGGRCIKKKIEYRNEERRRWINNK